MTESTIDMERAMKGDDNPPNNLCIYHANCLDGFAAAWVVKQALPNCVFHPGVYQDPPPDVTGLDVYLVDFSYKSDVILEMAKAARKIIIIDHHKSAIEDLVDLPDNVSLYTSLEKSGCVLSWDYFFGSKFMAVPLLLQHIQDRDLWKFELPKTKLITLALSAYDYDFDTWTDLIDYTELDPRDLTHEGEILQRKYQKDLHNLIDLTQRRLWIGGEIVPAANIPPLYASDAGNIMVQQQMGIAFAATYYDTDSHRVFSLRSVEGGMDVAEIAKLYGGGGHKHAAGFKVSRDQAWDFELAR